MLRFGITHPIVLDADKKFYNINCQMYELSNLNVHTIGGKNHDPMLIKCISNYLNKGLMIFDQEQGTPAISLETVLLLICAWNSCAVLLTDISRAMVATGYDFSFPIDFAHEKAIQLTGNKTWTETYTANQACLLLHVRDHDAGH